MTQFSSQYTDVGMQLHFYIHAEIQIEESTIAH